MNEELKNINTVIIGAIILFIARLIPFYKINIPLMKTKSLSLMTSSNLCDAQIMSLSDSCRFIPELDMIVIGTIILLTLIWFAQYLSYKLQ